MVLMMGYPGMGKRTVGSHLVQQLDGVLVDSALINRPLLELFQWDGKEPIPTEIWQRVAPIRDAVLGTIEDLAPKTNNYVFTNVLEDDDPASPVWYADIRSLAHRRGSLFLPVMLTCDINIQVNRVDNPDRIALRKGSDPQGCRWHRLNMRLYQPPESEVIHIDTTATAPEANAEQVFNELVQRGFDPGPH